VQGTPDGAAGAAVEIEVPPAGRLVDRDKDAKAAALVAGAGHGGQAGGRGVVERGQGVDAGGGEVVPRLGSTGETHSGNPSGVSAR